MKARRMRSALTALTLALAFATAGCHASLSKYNPTKSDPALDREIEYVNDMGAS